MDAQVFVFGSNEAGRHGAGAALHAKLKHGAVQGQGIGHHGNSYALPTKDYQIVTLPLSAVASYVRHFLNYAKDRPELTFNLTKIGCGLAGFTEVQIAPLFKDATDNVVLIDMQEHPVCLASQWINNT